MSANGPVIVGIDPLTASVVDATETLIATLPGVYASEQMSRVFVRALCKVTADAAATTCSIILYRGPAITGDVLAVFPADPVQIAAAAATLVPVAFTDRLPVGANVQYALTATLTSGGADTEISITEFSATTAP